MVDKFMRESKTITWRADRRYKEEWRREIFETFAEAHARYKRDKASNKYDDCRIVKETTEIMRP